MASKSKKKANGGRKNKHGSIEDAPGQLLRSLRRSRKISLKTIAEQTLIPEYKLQKLESDDYQGLGGHTYVLGYIRNYARALDVAPNSLMQHYKQKHQLESGSISTDLTSGVSSSSDWFLAAFFKLIVFVLGVTLVWWFVEKDGVHQIQRFLSTVAENQPRQGVGKSQANAALEDVAVLPQAKSSPSLDVNLVGDPNLVPSVSIQQADVDSVEQDVKPAPMEEPDVTLLAEDAANSFEKDDTLVLSFSDECWLQVDDALGETIFQGVRQRDDVLELNGPAPFSILLGHAAAVTLSINGQPQAITAHTNRKSLRLKVERP